MIESLRVSVDCENARDKEPELVFQIRDNEFFIDITRTQYMILRNLVGIPTFGSGVSLEELDIEPVIYESHEYLDYKSYELSFLNSKGTRYNLAIGIDESILLSALFGIEVRDI